MSESRYYEGETVTLKCDSFIHGNPTIYTYTWKRNSTILTNIADYTKDTLVFRMSQTDEAFYTCIVRNDYGETEESAPIKLSFVVGARPPEGMSSLIFRCE